MSNQQHTFLCRFLPAMLLTATAVDTAQAATPQSRPNIVVMMVDDMGFAGPSIAPYSNPHYKTPGMDRLASEGKLFTDFHASGAICSATRAGLVTGRYQQRAGIEAVIHPHATHPEHRKGLHEDEVTFAELFKAAGYSTGLVGKWHLGYAKETPKYHPMNHGFDNFMGYVSGNIDYVNHWGDHMEHDWWHGRQETKEEGYTTHLINKYALEFIEQNKNKPFCLYVAHESPHAPVQGPNDPIQRGPGRQSRKTPHAEAMKQMILEMDKGVEQVRAKLVELGLEKNTLFLFFSDNGDSPGTATGSPRFRGHKGSVYEGGTRVPAVAWWPGKIKPGTRADDQSITLDVMPTILSVAGIASPKERPLDGVDLSPIIFAQKALPLRPLFWANLNNNGSRSEALRDGPWKLVVQHPKAKSGTFENETLELFNLDDDEGEQANLATEQPERAAVMLKRIKAWYDDTQKTASPQPGGWVRKPPSDESFFNGEDLTGWRGNGTYWSVKDGAIVGHSDKNVPKNEFLWSDVEVQDFYLAVDVKLTPDARNAGIQFRSKPINEHGQALGYQADMGAAVWGKLYHEHGRGKLDWNNKAAGAVKPGQWNKYEILAVGHRIWTAINGKLCVAYEDPEGELSGKIAFQIHGGPPQTVHYRSPSLTHSPKVELAGINEQQLIAALPKKKASRTALKAIGLGPLKSPTTTAKPSAAARVVTEVPPLLRPLARPKTPVSAFTDGFTIDSDQMIVVLGGTNALESGRQGYLETLLTAAHPQHRVRLRNLAWQADTVYEQQRPRNFYAASKPSYGERDGRSRIKADIVFFWIGQSEALDGPERIDEFAAAYSQHIDQIADVTNRIVLVTPVPFSNPLNLEIDIKQRNKSLATYVAAIRKIGRERKLPVVDLYSAFLSESVSRASSHNGLHLSPGGHWLAANTVASQLGFAGRVPSITRKDGDGTLESAAAESLRQAIHKKNDLWFRYWRPTNWAFLYGNRQTQPSSRDHTNPKRRWFPEELKKALAHLDEAEQQIHKAAHSANQ